MSQLCGLGIWAILLHVALAGVVISGWWPGSVEGSQTAPLIRRTPEQGWLGGRAQQAPLPLQDESGPHPRSLQQGGGRSHRPLGLSEGVFQRLKEGQLGNGPRVTSTQNQLVTVVKDSTQIQEWGPQFSWQWRSARGFVAIYLPREVNLL